MTWPTPSSGRATPGRSSGNGLADVLLGEAEPTGRLAQAWPADASQAGDLLDYDVIATHATPWFARTAHRYGLGHGLTYGAPTYADLRCTPGPLRDGDEVVAHVTVTNPGARPAHELVQLYVDAPAHRLPYPHRVVAHARVVVPPGGTTVATLRVPVADLAVWDVTRDRWVVEPGRYVLTAAPSSAHDGRRAELWVAGEPVPPRDLRTRAARAVDADALTGVDPADLAPATGTCVQVRPRQRAAAGLRRGRGDRGRADRGAHPPGRRAVELPWTRPTGRSRRASTCPPTAAGTTGARSRHPWPRGPP